MRVFLIALLFVPLFSFGQYNIRGIVLDSINHQPIPYVRVYVNGTSRSSLTDIAGTFILNNITLPAQVVASQIGYSPKVTVLNYTNLNNITILLKERPIELSEMTVKGKNMRAFNVRDFKAYFIGSDYWGMNAVLKNEDALVFNDNYETQKVMIPDSLKRRFSKFSINTQWSSDSTYILKKVKFIEATANAPLLIDLPLLGYVLHVDLVGFTIKPIDGKISSYSLGYYYFEPYSDTRKIRKYEKKRQLAYYHSQQHFFRSLFTNSLSQNGYQLIELIPKKQTKQLIQLGSVKQSDKYDTKPINIDTCIQHTNDNKIHINKLNNRQLAILYFYKTNGKPINLSTQKSNTNLQSAVYFLSDTCTVRSDGTVPDINISFSGAISDKKAGASLPDDYMPLETPEPENASLPENSKPKSTH